jgi:hypothetical protein
MVDTIGNPADPTLARTTGRQTMQTGQDGHNEGRSGSGSQRAPRAPSTESEHACRQPYADDGLVTAGSGSTAAAQPDGQENAESIAAARAAMFRCA